MDHSALQINFSIISSITDVEKAAKRAHKGKIEPRSRAFFMENKNPIKHIGKKGAP